MNEFYKYAMVAGHSSQTNAWDVDVFGFLRSVDHLMV